MSWNRSPNRVRQNRPLPSKKSPDETQLSSRICSRKKVRKASRGCADGALRLSGGQSAYRQELDFSVIPNREHIIRSRMLSWPQREPVFICPVRCEPFRQVKESHNSPKLPWLAQIGPVGSQVQFDWKLHLQRI